jgi:cytochrome c biogenesis protein CcmG/thiol:disulfide interchange protein DsbE
MWRFLLPLGMAAALGVLLFAGLGIDPKLIPSPLIDKPAPVFDLPELNQPEARVSNGTLAGAPYVLNVWASWCPSCRDEHPVIEDLARSGKVRVVGLNWKDEPVDAKRWLAQFGNPYTDIAVDQSGRTGIDFGVYGAPETFLVDAKGVVRFKHVGTITHEVIAREIEPRLAQMQGAAP